MLIADPEYSKSIGFDANAKQILSDMFVDMNIDAGEKLAQWGAQSQQNKGFLAKLKKIITDLLNRLRSYFKNVDPESLSAKEFAKFDAKVKQTLAKMFVDMNIDAGEKLSTIKEAGLSIKNTATEGGVKYALGKMSTQNDITANYQKTVDSILKGTHADKSAVLLGYTPDIYQELGMPSLPFVIGPGHIYSAAKTEAEARLENRFSKKMHYHGLGDKAVKNIYKAAQDPLMIIASKDVNPKTTPLRSTHSVVAIIDVGTGNQHLLLPVEITAKRTVNGQEMDVNVLSSAYKKNVSELVREAVALENIGEVGVYYIKKGATLPADSGVQFPVHLSNKIASKGIIHRFSEKVNMNILDTTQSQQFKRWFGDWQNHPENASKIVNSDGTPKVMYHGSPAQFTIFDKKKAKSSGHYGRGFYFTDSQSHANTYGQLYSVYLNIHNPLKQGGSTVSRSQVRKFLEAVTENEDYSIENYGTYDVDAVLHNIMENASTIDAYQAIQNVSLTAIGDMVEAAELFNKVNGTKFDGIVAATETVAFYPEQIKSATDNIGTFDGTNPDIRYKLSVADSKFRGDFDYSGLNWAKDLGIITSKDTAIFERTINNEILRGAKPISANGEYIIDTGKCLMFTDGDFHAPTLSRVVVFETEYESLTADAKEMIYNHAEVTGDLQESLALIEETFGPGFASAYDARDYRTDGRQNGRGKGNNSSKPYRRNRPRSVKLLFGTDIPVPYGA